MVVGKGRKTSTVFFGPEALEAIGQCLDAWADQYRPLFIRHDHNAPKPDPAVDPEVSPCACRSTQPSTRSRGLVPPVGSKPLPTPIGTTGPRR